MLLFLLFFLFFLFFLSYFQPFLKCETLVNKSMCQKEYRQKMKYMKFFLRLKYLLSEISAKGFFHLLSANVLIQLVAFASQLFVAGILLPEDVGRIKIITTFLSVFSIIGGMGLHASTLKLCSENRSQKEIRELFSSGVVFTIVSTIVFYGLIFRPANKSKSCPA